MPDFHIVERPVFFPGECVTCKASSAPSGFVDTLVSIVTVASPKSRVYLCSVCATSAARLLGFVAPEDAQRLRETLAEQEARIGELEAGLKEASDNVVVSLSELKRELRPKPKARAS